MEDSKYSMIATFTRENHENCYPMQRSLWEHSHCHFVHGQHVELDCSSKNEDPRENEKHNEDNYVCPHVTRANDAELWLRGVLRQKHKSWHEACCSVCTCETGKETPAGCSPYYLFVLNPPPPQFFLFTVTQVQGEIESEKKMDKTITTIWWGNYTYPGMNTSLLSGQRGHSQTHCPSGEIQPLFATSENPSNVRLLQSHPHPNDYLKWNRNVSSSAPSCVSTSSSIRPHCVTECDL